MVTEIAKKARIVKPPWDIIARHKALVCKCYFLRSHLADVLQRAEGKAQGAKCMSAGRQLLENR